MADQTGSADDLGHGHSPAAWTGVTIMLIGFAVGTFFFTTNQPVGVWIGVGIIAAGLLTGWILSKAGYGVRGPKYQPKAQ